MDTKYSVVLSYRQDGTSSISYPAYHCSGHWTPVSIAANEATFIEQIDDGVSQCIPTGTVVVKNLGASGLSYEWRGSDELVVGELHRK